MLKKLSWRWPKEALALAVVLVIHTLLGLAFGVSTPIFEVPDEANHYLFIRYLQVNHALPVQTLDQAGPRAHHPPLYYLLGAALSAWVPEAGNADRVALPENPTLWFRYGDQNNDHKTRYIHSADEAWPYHGQPLAAHVVRLLSTVFSALAVLFTFLAAREFLPAQPRVAVLAAALLAFNPMVLFMSGTVQNSTSALASSAALVYALTYWLRRGFTPWRWVWTSVIFSAGVLLQTSGLTLAAPVAVVMLYTAWKVGPRWRDRIGSLFQSALAFGLPFALLTGWWFVRNQLLYGDWTANAIIAALWSDQPIMPTEQVLHLLVTGMVGRFGFGLLIEYADWVYQLTWWLALVMLAGLAKLAWAERRTLAEVLRRRIRLDDALAWLLQIATIAGVTAGLAAYIILFIRGGHGRYMFSAYPSLMILLAAGALAWFKPKTQSFAVLAFTGFTLALSLYGLFGLVIPTYALPRSPSDAELKTIAPLDANIADTVRVLGYKLNSTTLKPGQTLEVTVYWEVLSRTDVPYTVFVHLTSPEFGSLAQRDTYPGGGNYATTAWDVGRTFVETYRLSLPPDTPAASDAQIVLGLYNAQTMQRLPVTGANASTENDWVEFGAVQIQP